FDRRQLRLGRTALSAKELSRAEVMGRVKTGSLRLREAGELLELSYRQVKRGGGRYRGGGPRVCNMRTAGGGRIGGAGPRFGKRGWLRGGSGLRSLRPRG